MKYLDTSPAVTTAAQNWQQLFKKALLKRRSPEQLAKAFIQAKQRYRARPRDIACTLLAYRAADRGADDPLLFLYAEFLLKNGYFTSSDLLAALLKRSTFSKPGGASINTRHGLPSCEERVFTLLTHHHIASGLPKSALGLQELIHVIMRWLKQVSDDAMGKQLQGVSAIDYGTNVMYEALASLALSILGTNHIRILSKQHWWKARRAAVATEMQNYDTHVLQWTGSQLAGRLRNLTGLSPYLEIDAKGRPKFTDEQVLSQVGELPVVRSRAGTFIWLNAALTARPLTDDMTILSYLQGRCGDDTQALIVGLLVASFDVLTNSMLTREPRQSFKVIRSFICNKVPVMLTMLTGNMQPVAAENCISMAMLPGGMISMDPVPPLTSGSTDMRDSLKATRLDFLQACALHGLVSESTVGQILQEPVALPRVSKLNKETMVAQCANNISKLGDLVEELGGMQGNTGAIAACIVQVVSNLCLNKDTMSLKTVCEKLVRRIPYMDFVMQYVQPGMLLLPLCNLLNDWIHDQDQSEFTPAYEEFASILMFTLAVIHRYDLSFSEIGILGDSFVAKLLDNMTTSKPWTELPEEQASQLSRWIEGLFADDETSGIGDDVMRQCSPQTFYTLVPTLFEQSILACRSSRLSMSTFKGGLELLLEPFLLPSLIMGLGWLAEHSWEDHNDAEILIQVLEKLLKPSSSAQETQVMHRAVLAMVAVPLCNSLEGYNQKHSDQKALDLLGLLKPPLNQQRALHARKDEISEWMQSGGSLEGRLQQVMRELIAWAVTSTNPPNPPPKYTHRMFAVVCQLFDHDAILQAMVQEINRTSFSDMPTALDVATSLICAPASVPMGAQQVSRSSSPVAKLRDSVRLITANVQGLLDKPVSEAETLVRLSRRVEAQLAFAAHMPAIAIPMQMQEQAADQIMQDLGLTMDSNNTSGPGAEESTNQPTDMAGLGQQIDLSNLNNATSEDIAKMAAETGTMDIDQTNQVFMDFGMDTTDQQNSNTHTSDQQISLNNQEEDIFAGLDMMNDYELDFN